MSENPPPTTCSCCGEDDVCAGADEPLDDPDSVSPLGAPWVMVTVCVVVDPAPQPAHASATRPTTAHAHRRTTRADYPHLPEDTKPRPSAVAPGHNSSMATPSRRNERLRRPLAPDSAPSMALFA